MNRTTIILSLSIIMTILSCKEAEDPHLHDQPDSLVVQAEEQVISVTDKQIIGSGFQLGTLELREFAEELKVAGMIDLPERNMAEVSSYFGGTVGNIDLIHGQWVKKGQVLFNITNPELLNMQEELLILSGQMEYLQTEFSRINELATDKITTEKILQKAKSDLNTNEAQISALSQKLELYGISPSEIHSKNLIATLPVKSPISGYITDIHAIRGMYLEAGKTAITIANNHHIHLEIKILEKDVKAIKIGQKVQFHVQDNPSEMFLARVYLIDPMMSEQHLLNVHCHIEDEDKIVLKPGMYATAIVETLGFENLALPAEAIVTVDDDFYALRVMNRKDGMIEFEKVKIIPGVTQDGFTIVKNAEEFVGGSEFLTNGAFELFVDGSGGHDH